MIDSARIDQMSTNTFQTIYWGEDKSTRVQFLPALQQPALELVSACMVVAFTRDNKIALSKPERGWGIPGGHLEPGESAEECLRREAIEEAAIELGELTLIGYWATQKVFDSPHNKQYPDKAYQLLFIADIIKIHDFSPELEVSERAFVAHHEMRNLHHNYQNFKEIYAHALAHKGILLQD